MASYAMWWWSLLKQTCKPSAYVQCSINLDKPDLVSQAAHGISLFLVDASTPGFSKGQNLRKMGLKAQDTSELFFEDCRLPASALLGEENKGFYSLMTVRAMPLPGWCQLTGSRV